jgi:hypothetical protein
MTEPTFTLKELMLSPEGIVFEPPEDPDPPPDDPHAAAVKATAAARATHPAL